MSAIATANTSARTVSHERLSRLGLLQEPAGYVDGPSLYEYVGSDPVNAVDPLGLKLTMIEAATGDPAQDARNAEAFRSLAADYARFVRESLAALDQFGEQRFKLSQQHGSVLFAGKRFDGTFQEFRKQMERELEARSFSFTDSKELKDFAAFIAKAAATHNEDYDQLVVSFHGIYDPDAQRYTGQVRLNGKDYPQAEALKVVEEAMSKVRGRSILASCGRDGRHDEAPSIDWGLPNEQNFVFDPKDLKKCKLHFNPAKAVITKTKAGEATTQPTTRPQ